MLPTLIPMIFQKNLLENHKSESIVLDDNKIKSSTYNSDQGYGFRAVTGEVVAYSHSNDISKDSLRKSSDNLKDTLKSKKGTYNHEISKTNNKSYSRGVVLVSC